MFGSGWHPASHSASHSFLASSSTIENIIARWKPLYYRGIESLCKSHNSCVVSRRGNASQLHKKNLENSETHCAHEAVDQVSAAFCCE